MKADILVIPRSYLRFVGKQRKITRVGLESGGAIVQHMLIVLIL